MKRLAFSIIIFLSSLSANAATYTTVPLRGVNLSGAEFGSKLCASCIPTLDDSTTFTTAGMNTFRVPIKWSYLQPSLNGDLDTSYLQQIHDYTQTLLEAGYNVIIDLHAYMRFSPNQEAGSGQIAAADQVADVWSKLTSTSATNGFNQLAKTYDGRNKPNQLIFDLMNEPNTMSTNLALDAENAAIQSIRDNNLTNLVLIEGNNWTGLHSWTTSKGTDGLTNADAFTPSSIHDAANNYAINVHQYFDSNFSGASETCINPGSQSDLLNQIKWNEFIDWAKANKLKLFVTEFGSANNQQCSKDIDWFLSAIEDNAYTEQAGYGFIGWTAWSAGHAWGTGYVLGLNPGDLAAPLLDSTYSKHLSGDSSCTGYILSFKNTPVSISTGYSMQIYNASWSSKTTLLTQTDPATTPASICVAKEFVDDRYAALYDQAGSQYVCSQQISVSSNILDLKTCVANS